MRRLVPIVLGLVLVLVLLAVRVADPYPVRVARELAFDTFQQIAPREAADAPVRIADIDEASLAAIGQWPWSRDVMAKLTTRLTEMGAAAVDKADLAIVTDDNPRSEDPSQIRREILAAAPGAIEIGDRAEAIAEAIAMLEKGDVLLVAGKGHETGQTIGTTVIPFSDHDAVGAVLTEEARLG